MAPTSLEASILLAPKFPGQPNPQAGDIQPGTRRRYLAGVFAGLVLSAANTALAQIPEISTSGLPAEPLIGETFCVDVNFSNGAAATGYGPYLIGITDEGIVNLSVDFVDVPPQLELIGIFDASGTLVDPISGQVITGNEGAAATIARYPVGSVEQDKPPLELNYCGVVDVTAEVGVPLDVEVIPGFEYGDTPTGENGAILGSSFNSTVTPQLARVEKTNSAPESERPPGPSHTFNYRWELDVSQGVTVTDVVASDDLPANIQYTGGAVTINAPLGQGCQILELPTPPPVPGGIITVACDAVTGTENSNDLVVSLPVYITDILDETMADQEAIENTVSVDYSYQGDDYNSTDTSTVLALHAAAQKSVSGDPLPGEILEYSINFQLTDYPEGGADGATSFIFTDIVPDGMSFEGTLSLTINGANQAIIESVAPNTPAPGQTTVSWDIAAALGSTLPNGSTGTLRYETRILEQYNDGTPVQAADPLSNDLQLDYTLSRGATDSNGSDADTTITPNVPDKALTDPPPPATELMPGQEVTFTLTLDIPAGNTSNVTLVDFLPRPVFDVNDFDIVTDWTAFPPFDIPGPTVTRDLANNAVIFEFGDIDQPLNTQLQVDLRATVTSEPFADDLFLTNLVSSSYENSQGETITGLRAAGINVGAPDLVITKGVVSVTNPAVIVSPLPSELPVDGNASGADAGDIVEYQITVENIGGQNAYTVTVQDPVRPELDCAPVAAADVVDGNGVQLPFSGVLSSPAGLILTNPLSGNDGTPPEGGAPYGTDTAIITVRCELELNVEPGESVTNKATVRWVSTPGGNEEFPTREDEASVSIALPEIAKTVISTTPGYTGQLNSIHVGEIVRYQVDITVPEGTSSAARFEDVLDEGLAHVQLISVEPLSGSLATSVGSFADVANNAGFRSVGGGDVAIDRKLVIGPGNNDPGFGTVTNSDTNNATDEVIRVIYETRALNDIGNVIGTSLRNRARWYWTPPGGSSQNVQVRASRVNIVEPQLGISKRFNPNTGDNVSPPQVTIEVQHLGASNADAFDLSFTDVLPIDMGIVGGAGGVVLNNCPAGPPPSVVRQNGSDTLEISWPFFATNNGVCTITFDTEFIIPVVAGITLNNCAQVFWESMSDSDQPADGTPNSSPGIAVERTGFVEDPGTAANDYNAEACDQYKVFGVGINKTVVDTSQAHTDNIPGTPAGAESLTIGETVEFELVITVPEAPSLDLTVTDSLPRTNMSLEMVSAETVFVGADLIPTIADPTADIQDISGNGINDNAVLAYGFTTHILDGVTNDEDRIRIRVVAKVKDRAENANNDLDSNFAVVRFLPSATASDNYEIELVEPLLQLTKIGDRERVEAGEDIGYRLIVSHRAASRVDAKDLVLTDVLPTNLTLVGPITLGEVCSAPPTSGPSQSGNGITATWDTFPLGAVCEIEFSASVDITAETGDEITNTGTIAWTSLDTQGDEDDRPYSRSDSWVVVVSPPGLEKAMTASSVPDTPLRIALPTQKLTIGEVATFTLTATFADGTTPNARLEDLLPDMGVAMEFVDSSLTFIGSDLDIATNLQVGDPAVDCNPASTTCTQWILGDVVNQPDAIPSGDINDIMVFSVDAIVLDDPMNSGAPGEDDNLLNITNLVGTGFIITASDPFDIVEPQLSIQKLTESGGPRDVTAAGEQETFTLVIEHDPDSTAPALDVSIVDTLSPEMLWVDDATITSDCPGLITDSTPAAGSSGQAIFSISSLPLNVQRCSISFTVEMSATLPVPGIFINSGLLAWESAPGSSESREYVAQNLASLRTFSDVSVAKAVTATSVPETGLDEFDPQVPDAAIGEIIEYGIISRFSEGVTSGVVLTDTFQLDGGGELELLGGGLISLGANITTSLPGTPVVSGNTITVAYGDVTNLPDGLNNDDDAVIYRLELLVRDAGANSNGTSLLNEISMGYQGILGIPLTVTDETAVEVVEPELVLDKAFTAVEQAEATIRLDLTNNGTAAAYDVAISDEFDEAIWVPGSLDAISVPPGYALTEQSAGGITTVTLALENVSMPPLAAEILSPAESLTVVFSMLLQNDGQPGPTTIVNTAVVTADSLPGDNPRQRLYDAQASDTIFLPSLSLEKSWTGPNNPALPGDTITYTLELTNTGDAPASNVLITDDPDTLGEFQAGTVATDPGINSDGGSIDSGNTPGDTAVAVSFAQVSGGATVSISYDVLVPLPYPDGMTAPEELVNQASADSTELPRILSDDPDTPAPDDETVAPVLADPIMLIEKNDQVIFALPGDTIVYQIDYGNGGNQDATGVVITDTVPADTVFNAAASSAGWSCADGSPSGTTCQQTIGDLPGATGGSLLFAVTVLDPVASGVISVFNTVSITEDGVEFGQPPSTPSTDEDTEETPLFARPILEIFKNDGGISVTPGDRLRYAIVYRNVGAQTATGVVLTETVPADVVYDASASLPAWSCPTGSPAGTVCTIDVGELDPGLGRGAIFGLRVLNPARPGVSEIDNTAVLNDDGANTPVQLTVDASDDTPLIANPDLVLEKVSDGGALFVGKIITYTLSYRNVGDQNATGVVVRERVPRGTVFSEEDSAPTVWSCADGADAGTECLYNVGNLNAGASGEITFAVEVVEMPDSSEVTNIARTNDDGISGPDPTPLNNIARAIDNFLPSGIPALPALFMLLLALGVAGLGWRNLASRRRR